MANGVGTALGLSIGATNLAAAVANHAITRKPVLTLYQDRSPEVGIPAENPRLDQPGLVLTGFVNRVADPRGVVAADGSVHRSEDLIADAMRALAYAVTGGRALPERVAVTYPAHWASPVVDAVGTALSSVSEWSNRARPLLLIPDAAATLLAVRNRPGIPASGTVAVCDFGGSGTSITFMRADGDYQALAPTVRLHDFSGDLIDQALLSAVISNMPSTASFDPAGTVAIGSLSRLRSGCRTAKEQLSSSTVTTLTDGLTGEVRVTRAELDDAIRLPLDRFVAALEKALTRNGIHDLVAVVAAGGGANIPAITKTLSGYFRVPVVTTPRPHLTAATGAALRAAHGPGHTEATASAPAAPVTATGRAPLRAVPAPVVQAPPPEATATAQASSAAQTAGAAPVQAWSQTGHQSQVTPAPEQQGEPASAAEPPSAKRKRRLFRLPVVAAIVGTAAAVLLVGTAVTIGLDSANKSATTPAPGVSSSPRPTPPPPNTATAQPPSPTEEAPAPSTTDTNPPANTETPSTTVPPAKPQQAPPAVAAPARPAIPQIPEVPAIPPIPGVNEPIPGLDQVNQIIQGIGGNLGIPGIPQLGPQLGTTR